MPANDSSRLRRRRRLVVKKSLVQRNQQRQQRQRDRRARQCKQASPAIAEKVAQDKGGQAEHRRSSFCRRNIRKLFRRWVVMLEDGGGWVKRVTARDVLDYLNDYGFRATAAASR